MSRTDLLDSSNAVLLVIDEQDAFLNVVHERERVVGNTIRLIEAAKIFDIPILVTLQNADRFGDCTPEVVSALPHDMRFNKTAFSCEADDRFQVAIDLTGRIQIIICGVETHICVNQTAIDLLRRGHCVHVVADAVSSRTPENWTVGLEKMRDAGCVITSTEIAIFELTRDAASPEFKRVLPLVK